MKDSEKDKDFQLALDSLDSFIKQSVEPSFYLSCLISVSLSLIEKMHGRAHVLELIDIKRAGITSVKKY